MVHKPDTRMRLTVDDVLLPAWQAAVPGDQEPAGLAAAVTGSRGCVIVAPGRTAGDTVGGASASQLAAATEALAAVLGVRTVELIVVPTSGLNELVRAWAYQAGQGSGRGVHLRLEAESEDGPLRVLIRALDSSARELALRLASPQEPGLPALRALFAGREISIADEDSPSILS